MKRILRRLHTIWLTALLWACASIAYGSGPVVINPGSPQTVCSGDSVILGNLSGPTATGGTPPYTYMWAPATGMNNPSDSNPHVKVTTTTTFTVTVSDASGGHPYIDSVTITVDQVGVAGNNTSICSYIGATTLGAASNSPTATYTWSPSTGLSCTSCPNPRDSGLTSTTTYTLVATDGTCSNTTNVTVSVLPPATITTGPSVTIHRGQTTQLQASGGVSYIWVPSANLTGANTSDPIAAPQKTTTYTVQGTDANGCIGFDSVTVNVIDDSLLFIYNTFTPNHDGFNDFWVIGNIELYPNNEVDIYNRYGKEVYKAIGYHNQWDGSNLGEELPDATYYYIISTGTGQSYKGSVTIIRRR